MTLTAVKPGVSIVVFNYARAWEDEEPIGIRAFRITVSEDMSITYETMLTEEA